MISQLGELKVKAYFYYALGYCILTVISILFIDKPLALIIHYKQIDQLFFLNYFSELMPWVLVLLVLGFSVKNDLFTKHTTDTLVGKISLGLFSISYFLIFLELALTTKTWLKDLTGRYWPKTWIHSNLSLINHGVYGFNWGNGYFNQSCFPSGHTVFTVFCYFWLCYLKPQYRKVWLTLALIVPISLVCLDYHYLGDCLAGAGLAIMVATISLYFYQIYAVPRVAFLTK